MNSNLGINWYATGRKRPIAYSTPSDSDLIAVILLQFGRPTSVQELYDYFNDKTKSVKQPGVMDVLQAYIDKGFGKEQWIVDEATLRIQNLAQQKLDRGKI